MGSPYQVIELEWKGETRKLKPTVEFIAFLEEARGVSLLKAIQQIADQSLSITSCVKVVTAALNHVGFDATPQDVMEEYGTFQGSLVTRAIAIILACNYNPVAGDLEKK